MRNIYVIIHHYFDEDKQKEVYSEQDYYSEALCQIEAIKKLSKCTYSDRIYGMQELLYYLCKQKNRQGLGFKNMLKTRGQEMLQKSMGCYLQQLMFRNRLSPYQHSISTICRKLLVNLYNIQQLKLVVIRVIED